MAIGNLKGQSYIISWIPKLIKFNVPCDNKKEDQNKSFLKMSIDYYYMRMQIY